MYSVSVTTPFSLASLSKRDIIAFANRFKTEHLMRVADASSTFIFDQNMIKPSDRAMLVVMLSTFTGKTPDQIKDAMKYATKPLTATAEQFAAYYADKRNVDKEFIKLLENYAAGQPETLENKLMNIQIEHTVLNDMLTVYASKVLTVFELFAMPGETVANTITRLGVRDKEVIRTVINNLREKTNPWIAQPFKNHHDHKPDMRVEEFLDYMVKSAVEYSANQSMNRAGHEAHQLMKGTKGRGRGGRGNGKSGDGKGKGKGGSPYKSHLQTSFVPLSPPAYYPREQPFGKGGPKGKGHFAGKGHSFKGQPGPGSSADSTNRSQNSPAQQ